MADKFRETHSAFHSTGEGEGEREKTRMRARRLMAVGEHTVHNIMGIRELLNPVDPKNGRKQMFQIFILPKVRSRSRMLSQCVFP